jgi:hypothetical protein
LNWNENLGPQIWTKQPPKKRYFSIKFDTRKSCNKSITKNLIFQQETGAIWRPLYNCPLCYKSQPRVFTISMPITRNIKEKQIRNITHNGAAVAKRFSFTYFLQIVQMAIQQSLDSRPSTHMGQLLLTQLIKRKCVPLLHI